MVLVEYSINHLLILPNEVLKITEDLKHDGLILCLDHLWYEDELNDVGKVTIVVLVLLYDVKNILKRYESFYLYLFLYVLHANI